MHNTLSTIHAQHPIPGTDPLTSDRRDFLIRAGFGAAAMGGLSAAGSSAMAAGPQPAPGKLSGADNFYQSDKVAVRKVIFKNQYRMAVAGNLFVPKNLDRSKKNPAILVGHPMGAVKEQSANLYATKMAEQGFVALSLDLPFWGESDGQPRNAVAPDIYAEAFSAAVDFLGTQAMVDRERIGASFRRDRRAFQRIERDVDLRPGSLRAADLLADIEHRRLVALALADHHGAVDLERVERLAHRFDCGSVGGLFVAPPDQLRRGDRGCLGHADEFEDEDAIEHAGTLGTCCVHV